MDAVERQLAAYNARDVDAFIANFAPDVRVLNGLGEVTLQGWEAKRERYDAAFKREPDVRCEVLHRIRHGEFVVDHEFLAGYQDGSTKHAVAIYRVVDDLIVQVQFL